MNLRLTMGLLFSLAFSPYAVLADAGQPAASPAVGPPAETATPCPPLAGKQFNTAQVTTDCCKDHKGVCGCRAGKIVCCDRTISEQPGCTCHGEDGFPE